MPGDPVCGATPAGCVVTGCRDPDEVCDTTSGCAPSDCECDADGSWVCTDDCNGGECVVPVVEPPDCGPNPAGCVATGCPNPDEVCDTTLGCKPSVCSCSGGLWACTGDCNGGECVVP